MATHFSTNDFTNFSSPHLSDYAEIIVVRHGETAWNAISKIQ
ncbi:putative phosphoglycerate mutase GpmB-like, partial [Trifolium medium]|nr:putative phosphoglycerate mutase GpmB-like [Trifolium medium]